MNYIYLKRCLDAPLKGDLTSRGIIDKVNAYSIELTDGTGGDREQLELQPIIPLLIMDAPEDKLDKEDWVNSALMQDYKKRGIPFNSNEQVWNYLKRKEIKPMPEGLYKFDEEFTTKLICSLGEKCEKINNKDLRHECTGELIEVAIITSTEVSIESEAIDLIKHYENWCKITKRNGGILIGSSMREFLIDLKQHFKIERRKP